MAYKALNCFINSKVGSRSIELPISKLNMLSQLINSGKRRFSVTALAENGRTWWQNLVELCSYVTRGLYKRTLL